MTKTNTRARAGTARPGKSRKATRTDLGTSAAPAPAPKTSKSDKLIALLSRPQGATIEQMMEATGWQAHSVRGFLAGTLKKRLGKGVTSEKTDAGRIYRIAAGSAA